MFGKNNFLQVSASCYNRLRHLHDELNLLLNDSEKTATEVYLKKSVLEECAQKLISSLHQQVIEELERERELMDSRFFSTLNLFPKDL